MSISSIHSSALSWAYEAPGFRSDPGAKASGDLASSANPTVAKPTPSVQREPATTNNHGQFGANAPASAPQFRTDPIVTASSDGILFHDPLQSQSSLNHLFGGQSNSSLTHTNGPIHMDVKSTGRGVAKLQMSMSKLPYHTVDPNAPSHPKDPLETGAQLADETSSSSTMSPLGGADQAASSGTSHTNGPGPAGPNSPGGAAAKLQLSLSKLGLRLAGRDKHAGYNEILAGNADLAAHEDHHEVPQSVGTYTMTLPGISSYEKAMAAPAPAVVENAPAASGDWPGVVIDA